MIRNAFAALVAIVALSTAAFAGTIHGKVSGVKSQSVVYVEAVAGKTFPAPSQHVTMDQKGLMFVPHILAVQQGTTVEFLNSDQWQQEAGPQPRHLAPGAAAIVQIR